MVQVFRDCDPNQVEGWVRDLEGQSQISPLWEVFFQLMCHPVPQVTPLCVCLEQMHVLSYSIW